MISDASRRPLAAPADLQALRAQPASSSQWAFTNQLVAACFPPDAAAFEDALRRWYDDALAPKLQAAQSDAELTEALREYDAWKYNAKDGFLTCDLPGAPALGSRLADAFRRPARPFSVSCSRADRAGRPAVRG